MPTRTTEVRQATAKAKSRESRQPSPSAAPSTSHEILDSKSGPDIPRAPTPPPVHEESSGRRRSPQPKPTPDSTTAEPSHDKSLHKRSHQTKAASTQPITASTEPAAASREHSPHPPSAPASDASDSTITAATSRDRSSRQRRRYRHDPTLLLDLSQVFNRGRNSRHRPRDGGSGSGGGQVRLNVASLQGHADQSRERTWERERVRRPETMIMAFRPSGASRKSSRRSSRYEYGQMSTPPSSQAWSPERSPRPGSQYEDDQISTAASSRAMSPDRSSRSSSRDRYRGRKHRPAVTETPFTRYIFSDSPGKYSYVRL